MRVQSNGASLGQGLGLGLEGLSLPPAPPAQATAPKRALITSCHGLQPVTGPSWLRALGEQFVVPVLAQSRHIDSRREGMSEVINAWAGRRRNSELQRLQEYERVGSSVRGDGQTEE